MRTDGAPSVTDGPDQPCFDHDDALPDDRDGDQSLTDHPHVGPQERTGRGRRRSRQMSRHRGFAAKSTILLTLLSWPWSAAAQPCIPLADSTACPAFSSASISRDQDLFGSFPFLAFVSNTEDFDEQLNQYIETDWARLKYQQLFGCRSVNLSDTSTLYARYTASTICSAIVQSSRTLCSLSEEAARPLCADSCAQQAISEQQIISNEDICPNPSPGAIDQIRADFTVCSLPSDSLSEDCITGSQNERDNCGYAANVIGLCSYCAKSSPNATDSCCFNSDVSARCDGVDLPTPTALPPLFPTSTSSGSPGSPGPTRTDRPVESANASDGGGLSAGAIAGIVVGSIVGLLLLLALVAFVVWYRRRRRGSHRGSVFNQPSPQRRGGVGLGGGGGGGGGGGSVAAMAVNPARAISPTQRGYEVLPGGRVARMSALEGPSGDSSSPSGAAGSRRARSQNYNQGFSSSDEYGDTPESRSQHAGRGPLPPPPALGRRTGSLSSGSGRRRRDEPLSPPPPSTAPNYSSPEGATSQRSEQLNSFKDYYSTDEIHPGDKVSTLWAYQPRADDEFHLERGDMLKIVGIWDDGWATGIRLNMRAEDWDPNRRKQRDSGMSSGSEGQPPSPTPVGDSKAFPIVCVCLPDRWKALEAELSTETESSGREVARTSG